MLKIISNKANWNFKLQYDITAMILTSKIKELNNAKCR